MENHSLLYGKYYVIKYNSNIFIPSEIILIILIEITTYSAVYVFYSWWKPYIWCLRWSIFWTLSQQILNVGVHPFLVTTAWNPYAPCYSHPCGRCGEPSRMKNHTYNQNVHGKHYMRFFVSCKRRGSMCNHWLCDEWVNWYVFVSRHQLISWVNDKS